MQAAPQAGARDSPCPVMLASCKAASSNSGHALSSHAGDDGTEGTREPSRPLGARLCHPQRERGALTGLQSADGTASLATDRRSGATPSTRRHRRARAQGSSSGSLATMSLPGTQAPPKNKATFRPPRALLGGRKARTLPPPPEKVSWNGLERQPVRPAPARTADVFAPPKRRDGPGAAQEVRGLRLPDERPGHEPEPHGRDAYCYTSKD